ncbi:MAG: hypothetical protein GYA31_01405 [Parcubacteria group bacterium]|nr:hypothetical protein [Parcubacteria group bacterium]
MVTKNQVEEIIRKYQPLLHLEDWQIHVDIVTQRIIHKFGHWKEKIVFGCAFIHDREYLANIYIWQNADKNTTNLSLEAIVVHEMIHIIADPITMLFNLISDISNKPLQNLLKAIVQRDMECFIDRITRIVLELGGDPYVQDVDYRLRRAQTLAKANKVVEWKSDLDEQ